MTQRFHDNVPPAAVGMTRTLAIALFGNPNTGKTTLFNALAGMRQRTGNYPGVTVELKKGRYTHGGQTFDLFDVPGTYSLAPRSPDEMVAVNLALGLQAGEPRPDVIVAIVDASNPERNLYLVTQLMELGRPLVVALNMVDVAEHRGRGVAAERLAANLGLPVVPIQANKQRGLDALKQAIALAVGKPPPRVKPRMPEAVDRELDQLRRDLPQDSADEATPEFLLQRALFDAGGYVEERMVAVHGPAFADAVHAARIRLADAGCPVPAVEVKARYAWIRSAVQGCVTHTAPRTNWTEKLDRVLTHKFWGTLVFLLVMAFVFQSIFYFAQFPMDGIKALQGWLADGVQNAMDAGPLRSLLVGGIINGVGSVVVFLPQIMILFGFIAILEDCGYMARAAFLMDKLMARCGLSGKSFIPLLSSFACAIPGIMAARVIEDRRDRLATILVAPLMSCSARLPVYTILISAFLTEGHAWYVPGLTLLGFYLIGIVVAPLVALTLKRTLLRGDTPLFLMELPPYQRPAPAAVAYRMLDRGWAFLRRAGTLILASMIVVWALLYFPHVGTDAAGAPFDYDRTLDQMRGAISDAERDAYNEAKRRLAELDAASAGACGGPAVADERQRLETQIAPTQTKLDDIHRLHGEWKRQSILGRIGRWIEPAVEPLGWNWKIGMAALASFPAREVVVGTLGIIYDVGEDVGEDADEDSRELEGQLAAARWEPGTSRDGQPVFTIPVALSIMVFFALCCQCVSTLVIMRRETNSWRWPLFTFAYMTTLAYLGALATYQIGSLWA